MEKAARGLSAYLAVVVLAVLAALFILGIWHVMIIGTTTYCLSAISGMTTLSVVTAIAISYTVSEYIRRKSVGVLSFFIALTLILALYITQYVLANTAYARLC